MDTASTDDIERRAASGDPEAQLVLALRFDFRGAAAILRSSGFAVPPKRETSEPRPCSRCGFFPSLPSMIWKVQDGANEAAREGSADATHLLAIVTAEGLGGVPQSWPGALDYLERAAELGQP